MECLGLEEAFQRILNWRVGYHKSCRLRIVSIIFSSKMRMCSSIFRKAIAKKIKHRKWLLSL